MYPFASDNPLLPDIPDDVIADLLGRFTTNIPEEEQSDLIRMCFQVELAHWMFVDKYCTKEGARLIHLAHIPFPTFATIMFRNTPSLRHHLPFMDYIINNFRDYKQKVPTFGAILLNTGMTQVLLVQGFGNSWGFPKGKINQEENVITCAIREVKEETGYDIARVIRPNHFIESMARDRKDRLYVVVGVDTSYNFKPNTLYEIRQIAWFGLEEIPESKKDQVVSRRGYNNSNFFTIYPYIRRLKKWIADKKSGANQLQNFRCVGPEQCHFPFPYPMGFRGTKQFSPEAKSSCGSEGHTNSQSQEMDDERFTLNFLDWTPKNDIRYSGFGVPHTSECIPEPQISSTARNPKRRLFVDEIEGELGITNSITNLNLTFLEGSGAKAWLNFKLDAGEIFSGF